MAITGASGFVGCALTEALRSEHVSVVRIGRGQNSDVRWDVEHGALDSRALEGVDAVVNLAGATIAQRWTAARKRAILESRVHGTALLVKTLSQLARPPRVLISGSAVGVYGDRGDETLTEASRLGDGFLADVARAWEHAGSDATGAGIRVVSLRTGVVLGPGGGALAKMLTPFRFGVGGRVGNGRQWMSWIGLHDMVRAIRFLLTSSIAGAVNAVAPSPVTASDFARALGAVLRRPALVPVPAFALRVVFGEMADETLLASQRAIPARLSTAGFSFDEPQLTGALRRELGRRPTT